MINPLSASNMISCKQAFILSDSMESPNKPVFLNGLRFGLSDFEGKVFDGRVICAKCIQ